MNPSDDDLRALYRSASPEPPAALDDAIRRAARAELEGADAPVARRRSRWLGPGLGAAAGVLLAVVVLPLALREEQVPLESVPSRFAPSAPLSDPETIVPIREAVRIDEEAETEARSNARKAAPPAPEAGDAPAAQRPAAGAARALRAEPPAPAGSAPPEAEFAPAAELSLRMAAPAPDLLVVLEQSGSVLRVRAGWPRHGACTTAIDVGLPVAGLAIELLGGTADGSGEGLRILAPDGPLVVRCTAQGWSASAP
jgi:hypothetical protein